ncbi:MAG: Helicase associated domain protein [Boseongicola sp.]|nr:Helicase associated domain protein [Boseongicola sp.]
MKNDVVTIPRHRHAGHFSESGLFSGLKDFGELERRIEGLATPHERGHAFEVFAEAYLNTQKISQAADVWPEGAVPGDLVRQLKLPQTDMGIDGVYQTLGGGYAAYQVKFRTGRKAQTWSGLSTFVGLADRADLKVLFTNSSEVLDVVTDRRDIFCIRGADLDRLTKDDLAAIDEWLCGGIVKRQLLSPRPHQEEALQVILSGLENHERVTTVMACGTGKTLTALWLAERQEPERVIVLLTSSSLVRQTPHEWLKQTRWKRPRFLAVCSDPTVTRGTKDTMVVHQADLDFPVTTEAYEVKQFLDERSDSIQVVFSTYQSAHVVGAAMEGQKPFDLGIFDEAHKTAGREGSRFAFALDDANLPITKRVFMTATPRHYNVRSKDKEGDKKLVYSMDVPEVYGPIVHTLSFAQAAREGIICDFKVIISVVTSKMINDALLKHGEVLVGGDPVKARSVATQIALKQACEEHELSKVFSFHSSVASAKDFTGDTASGIKTHMPAYHALHINGAMRTAAREQIMREFREADRAIISNARCLTEGVDVPAVDVVAFLSPRKSKVDIVQAAGRAMRRSDRTGKKFGYLLLPLFLETEARESVDEALERTGFSEAWDVLQAMQEQDAALADIIQEMRVERGRTGGFDDSRLREKIEVLGPKVSLEALRKTVVTSIVDHLGITWDERFGELARYKKVHGICNVPNGWPENPQLANWVIVQRTKRDKLPADKLERLNELGFDWAPGSTAWERMYSELIRYKDKHGSCNVPVGWPENKKLAAWVAKQRRDRDKLPANRVERLNALEFDWAPDNTAWERMYSELARYHDEHGDWSIPRGSPEYTQLANWVTAQRTKRQKLPLDKQERLDALGFDWNPRATLWERMYAQLVRYKKAHGDCNVPQGWSEDPELGSWVRTQRGKHNKLSADRKERLIALGFEWDPDAAAWERMFAKLVSYKEEHVDCNVPARWPEDTKLANWVTLQRTNRDTLSADRLDRLEALGFDWDLHSKAWMRMYRKLARYKKEHGDCLVPQKWCEDPELARWVPRQRGQRETLSAEKMELLNALGFDWGPERTAWERMFAELVRYKEAHGDCNVPAQWSENQPLASWVITQRGGRDKLPKDRRERLDALGFDWDPRATLWERKYEELMRYKDVHGDCNVPADWPESTQLAHWVTTQRTKRDMLSEDRTTRLNALGFEWDPYSTFWERMYAELVRYKELHGDCNVPDKWPENAQLSTWVRTQRANRDKLSAEKVRRLSALGYDRDPRSTLWERMYAQLVRYKEAHGDCNVPAQWPENKRLGSWVNTQRTRRDWLSTDRLKCLNALGFDWDPRSTLWELRYEELVRYKEVHGDCDVPAKWPENTQLATWVGAHRAARKSGNMTDERRHRLEAVGFRF